MPAQLPIPSPYNFVPLSSHVFFPDWAEQVSHDVPFSDGISGWLDIEVEAMTQVFIRSGGNIPEPNSPARQRWVTDDDYLRETKEFARLYPGGPFAIPGTSLKGMIRAVMEIAAFGKMNFVDGHRYAVRDLNNPDPRLYRDHMTETLGPRHYRAKARAGWLRLGPQGDWQVTPCAYARIEQGDLEDYHRDKTGMEADLGCRQSAKDKYSQWRAGPVLTAEIDNVEKDYPHTPGRLRYRKAYLPGSGPSGTTEMDARVVFTGQPAPRQRPPQGKSSPKHQEFLFFGEEPVSLRVVENVRDDFIFAHSEPNGSPNEAWGDWKAFLENGRPVPVFFLMEGSHLSKLGLALMFRLPYDRSIEEVLDAQQPQRTAADLDLAEAIFGQVDKPGALKGRVSFEPAIIQGPSDEPAKGEFERTIMLPKVVTVLGAPKPSFYPNYLEQDAHPSSGLVKTIRLPDLTQAVPDYRTFMSSDARLRGWKRYPVWKSPPAPKPPPSVNGRQNLAVATAFFPLGQKNGGHGPRFTSRVHVHNLRRVEVGALLWALTWGRGFLPADQQPYCHSLGLAKPYGYGAVRVTLGTHNLSRVVDGSAVSASVLTECLDEFCQLMERFFPGWENCEQLHQLLAMADPAQAPGQPGSLNYPNLTVQPRQNDFAGAKRDGLSLPPYSPWRGLPDRLSPSGVAISPPLTQLKTVAAPLPDLSGCEIAGSYLGPVGETLKFKFRRAEAPNEEYFGLVTPPFLHGFKRPKRLGDVRTLRVAGPPDTGGRYPLVPPGD